MLYAAPVSLPGPHCCTQPPEATCSLPSHLTWQTHFSAWPACQQACNCRNSTFSTSLCRRRLMAACSQVYSSCSVQRRALMLQPCALMLQAPLGNLHTSSAPLVSFLHPLLPLDMMCSVYKISFQDSHCLQSTFPDADAAKTKLCSALHHAMSMAYQAGCVRLWF